MRVDTCLSLLISSIPLILGGIYSVQQKSQNPPLAHMPPRQPPAVPSPLVIAYASHGNETAVRQAVAHGVNVIIWFSITLESVDDTPQIVGSVPSPDYVGRLAREFRKAGRDILHLVCIGGWNAPLPDISYNAETWFSTIDSWNRANARSGLDWNGFDGFDWDAEGHDDPANVRNHVKPLHLTLIGELSTKLKRAGYVVTMAPAQSYLDVDEHRFDLELTHSPSWKSDFEYHGRNLYAYWLAFYGKTKFDNGTNVDTFDWVCLQFYEGFSRANNELASKGIPISSYLDSLAARMSSGWNIDFNSYGGIRSVSVPRSSLVIGLANGWSDPFPPTQKFLLLLPEQIREGWAATYISGFAFWTIDEEGREINGKPLYLAKELADIVNNKS